MLVASALPSAAASANAGCDDILPGPIAPAAKRAVSPEDIVRLRDIGQPDGALILPQSPLGLSPDGGQVAFVLTRADIANNGYCRALVVADIKPGARARVVDKGGELITVTEVRRGLVQRGGFPELIVPAWSTDGKWIAYLRRDEGVTQAWRARADGSGAVQVTHAPIDVEAIAWSADGLRLIYSSRPGLLDEKRAIEREGEIGFLYDDRFVPAWGGRPQLRGTAPYVAFSVDLASGEVGHASTADGERLEAVANRYLDMSSRAVVHDGREAFTKRSGDALLSPMQIWTRIGTGAATPCTADACTGSIIGLWWAPDGRDLIFLKREGWARGEMALYRWTPGGGNPRRLFATEDVLQGCRLVKAGLLCTRENATMPRRLVLIDPSDGRTRLVFDPNPEFAHLTLGRVERLKWKNAFGLEAWGDLVLPPGYKGGRLPLVVVQYHSRGFLRGGTGDEYPIHPLAARGFAVMSFERPRDVASAMPGLTTYEAIEAANAKDWADRRSVLSAIETGVKLVVDRGIADPAKVGLTGLSDGATNARFALINSRMFAAAAISTCCMDPVTVMTYGGIAWAESLKRQGYPPLTKSAPDFWKPFSTAVSADAVDAPLLMQLSDDEYLLALETFTALHDRGKPVEMYVFPNEHHAKWQPRHRLAVYERNLDWFAFWLQGHEDPDPAKAQQYARWRALRRLTSKHGGLTGGTGNDEQPVRQAGHGAPWE